MIQICIFRQIQSYQDQIDWKYVTGMYQRFHGRYFRCHARIDDCHTRCIPSSAVCARPNAGSIKCILLFGNTPSQHYTTPP